MKLTTVLGASNLNPEYYKFIPKQILFWSKFNIRFVAVLIADKIPDELNNYSENIILWERNQRCKSAFVAQNIRIYYPALLDLPDDEMVMITDMDMLPLNGNYYTSGLENFEKDDFIYYRHIDNNEVYMCYNAAHPDTWKKAFQITSVEDIERRIEETYNQNYSGEPGESGWFIDQLTMYKYLTQYPRFHVLNRQIKRLETFKFIVLLMRKKTNFISEYDDCHFHRSYSENLSLIQDAEKQLNSICPSF